MTHRSLKLAKTAVLLAFLGIAQAANAVTSNPSCDTAQATQAGRQAAVKAAYADISTVRQATAGTVNDGYAQAQEQRAANQRCMFDASNAMGNIVSSGGDLSGLVSQLTSMLTNPNSGCQVTAQGIADAAKQQAVQYAQRQASQAVGQATSQVTTQAQQAVNKALNGALPAPVNGGQYNLNGMTQQMTSQQIDKAWGQLSKSLNQPIVNQ